MKLFSVVATAILPLAIVAKPLAYASWSDAHYAALARRMDTQMQNQGAKNALTESVASGETQPHAQVAAINAAVNRAPPGDKNIRGGGMHTSATTSHLHNSDSHVTVATKDTHNPNQVHTEHTGTEKATGHPTGDTADFVNANKGKAGVKPGAGTAASAIGEGMKQKAERQQPQRTQSGGPARKRSVRYFA